MADINEWTRFMWNMLVKASVIVFTFIILHLIISTPLGAFLARPMLLVTWGSVSFYSIWLYKEDLSKHRISKIWGYFLTFCHVLTQLSIGIVGFMLYSFLCFNITPAAIFSSLIHVWNPAVVFMIALFLIAGSLIRICMFDCCLQIAKAKYEQNYNLHNTANKKPILQQNQQKEKVYPIQKMQHKKFDDTTDAPYYNKPGVKAHA